VHPSNHPGDADVGGRGHISWPQKMLAPPRPHCAFGSSCPSQPEGQEPGPEICTWCKNMSFNDLYDLADTLPEYRVLRGLIDAYFNQLERDCDERIAKEWSYPCACKDPKFSFKPWRRTFNPQDSRACGTVPQRGQLCARCLAKAREQGCEWLNDNEDERPDFPCIFEDPRMRRPSDINWKRGPVDERGRPNPDWEKDARRHVRCTRSSRRYQLCQMCFNRMCEIRRFGRYFDTNWGTLHEQYR
jgi:hypothetical protein